MKAQLTDFNSGWSGLTLELSTSEIDQLIDALGLMKSGQGHFHFRSTFTGAPGMGDVEVRCSGQAHSDDLTLDIGSVNEPDGMDT